MRLAAAASIGVALAMCAASAIGATGAQPQRDVRFLLGMASAETVTEVRQNCAAGKAPADMDVLRRAGISDLPDLVDGCVAALTRLGRDGSLGFIHDAGDPTVTPALAFDSGFVSAYRRSAAIPAALPTMAAVKTIAARCLAQAEPDARLCTSAGYVYGTRVAHGEAVPTS